MAEPSTARAPFRMVGARTAVLDGPNVEAIEQQIHTIESTLESVPDLAFDLSKTLVESVCKTVLADIGQPADPKWNAQKLLKETTNFLALLPRNHPASAKGRGSVKRTIQGLLQTIQGLCELRNSYGMASHGRDDFSPRLGLRQATLAAQAADTIVSFLYRIHRDALMQNPGARIYYEDHADFNEAFDNNNETIRVSDLGLRPSEVLFKGDPEAYKAALNDHIAEQNGFDDRDNPIAPGDDGLEAG